MADTPYKSPVRRAILTVAVCLLTGSLLAAGIPKFIHARERSLRLACMNHLIQIDGAKQEWKLEHKKSDADIPTWEDLKPYIAGNVDLKCPAGGKYAIGKVGEYPSCSISNHSLKAIPPEK